MMGHRTKLKGGDEWDAFSPWRKLLCYLSRPGVPKSIKRKYNKRVRQEEKAEIYDETRDWFV